MNKVWELYHSVYANEGQSDKYFYYIYGNYIQSYSLKPLKSYKFSNQI